jgi:GNAT superfamily N-acetyltransferase
MTTPILLSTEKDKLGNNINIYLIDSINMSPIIPFFLRHYSELMINGHSYPSIEWDKVTEHYGAIYAEQDEKILGHIVFSREHIQKEGYLWIVLSAVEHECRGRGIYTMLHEYFESHAKKLGCWAIASFIHKNNAVRLASAAKVGMAPVFHFMGKRLK